MKKIIFLRGVTPTGTNRIPKMSYLVEILTEVGFLNVQTYIQSGNILLESELSDEEIRKLVHDTILDKYIKQHREEIEADKFTNIQTKKDELQSLDDLIQEAKETIDEETEPVEEVSESEKFDEEEGIEGQEFILPPLEEILLMDKNLVEPVTEPLVVEDDDALQEEYQSLSRSAQAEDEPQNKKLWVILSALLAIIVLIIGGSYYVYRQITRSSQEIQSQSINLTVSMILFILMRIKLP